MTELYIASIVIAGLLFIPGTLLLRSARLPWCWSICCSPLLSLSLIALICQVYSITGIPSTPVSVFGCFAVLIIIVTLAVRGSNLETMHSLPRIHAPAIFLYLIIGSALGYNLFISRLGSSDALFQAYDVTWHLDIIQAMFESHKLTSLGVSPYMAALDASIAPINYSGFYPAAWHALCALSMMIDGSAATVVINASMFALACLVFPLATLAFVSAIFPDKSRAQYIGALASLAFVSFPWNLVAFGPVYANVAGFAILPAVAALFIVLFSGLLARSEIVRVAVALFLGAIGLALCHPNTIFSCVVILSPYCVRQICAACDKRSLGRSKKLLLSALFVAFVLLVWTICYKLPFMQDTVTHVWKPYAWSWQEIVNILTLSYTFEFSDETAAQWVLAAIVVVGAIRTGTKIGSRWLLTSYLVPCFILLISATHSDSLKQFLAGFWYTDPMRLASVCVIAAIPLSVIGIDALYELTLRTIASHNPRWAQKPGVYLTAGCLGILFIVLNFMPSFNLPGSHYRYSPEDYAKYAKLEERDRPVKSFRTTFGDYRLIASSIYRKNSPLDSTEISFLNKASELIQDSDALIVNDPMDGSFLSYGTHGLRVYYRKFSGFGGSNESVESKLIRLHLSEYATNEDVRAAVEKIDARYVIVLRGKETESGFINLRSEWDQSLFTGITSITQDTPGFTCLYSVGPMGLYEINR